jgi:hypothetical protein
MDTRGKSGQDIQLTTSKVNKLNYTSTPLVCLHTTRENFTKPNEENPSREAKAFHLTHNFLDLKLLPCSE